MSPVTKPGVAPTDRERTAEERRRDTRKAGARASRAKWQTKYRKISQDARREKKSNELKGLLEEVLRVEPWNPQRHHPKTSVAWGMCAERVPGYWHKGDKQRLSKFLRRQVRRMVVHVDVPTRGVWWKSNDAVVELVRTIAAELEANIPRVADTARGWRERCYLRDSGNGVTHCGALKETDDVIAYGDNPAGARGDGRED